ncbi:hypothetical protein P153DRAFT_302912 [Dothidotthia symphoricarpi CBS 119687]|uniref:Uncharacterized protein n=1 Tax=Dothidotthia symphoricarpi CBS 119687 TaxID=1392245 RepID=A0A6A5ZWX9_9PLEO|nr:uncharacterized protein P153DRAFT_302912 [Dothidotthia symphoricarpi CBS 119687]KAF2124262.1 hypothetical protein P153DRAFT_302912 [Dothidotthia symphoricarpi CBS 119687]
MATHQPSPTSAQRPYNAAITGLFILCSVGGLLFMRIATVLNDVPRGFFDLVAASHLPNGVAIKKHFTGIGPLDNGLSFLVTAFITGSAKLHEPFYWNQVHFIIQFMATIVVMNVEACRERHRGRWWTYTAIIAFVYQNIGGAIIIPWWWVALHRASADASYFSSGRTVDLAYARIMLPSAVALFLIPTIATLVPWSDMDVYQNVLAFWQVTPLGVNVPLWIASFFASTPSTTKNRDIGSLKFLYEGIFMICTITHWFAIYGILTSTDPTVTLSSVFVPNTATWTTGVSWGLLWIFQWDWVFIATSQLLACWIAYLDVTRALHQKVDGAGMLKHAIRLLVLVLISGPGGALASVWGSREEKMMEIEEKAEVAKSR